MATPEQIRSAVQAYVRALCESDDEGIAALYAPDASVEDPVGGEPIRGREALRAFYARVVPNVRAELTGPIRVAGRECAFPMRIEMATSDRGFCIDVVDVMSFDDAGRITSMRAYWGPADVRPAR